MRAAVYLRISQDKTGEAAGVKRQREDCLALVDQLGWQVVDVYTDNDVSASSGKPRPAYRKMLSDIEAGRIDAIIAWHTDRLYRRLGDLEELANLCDTHKLAVRTSRAGEIDMSTPTGRMIARMLGTVAQFEVEQKADRWLRSYRQRREGGEWMASGPRTFGYTRSGDIIPEEAAVLRGVVAALLSGVSMNAACRSLQDAGTLTTRGNQWEPASLKQLLRSPRIAGLSVLKGEVIGQGSWKPILDRETWERVGARLASTRIQQRSARRSLLTGLVFCGFDDCGLPLARGSTSMPAFRCGTPSRSNGHVTISAARVETMVERYARAKLSTPEFRAWVTAELSSAGSEAADLVKEMQRLDDEILQLETTMAAAETARAKLAVTKAIDEADGAQAALRARLSLLSPVELPKGDEWPTDLDRRSALIRLAVRRVVILPAQGRGGRFDPARVVIEPVEDESPITPST